MTNYRFERAARRNRSKALWFTLFFHALLLGGLFFAGSGKLKSSLPEPVKEFLGLQESAKDDVPSQPQP